ncbi:hypothetical protein V3C99_018844 [Haemonchus contortus]
MEDVRTLLERIKSNTFDVAKPSDLNDANVALTIRWDEIHQDVKRTRELLERHNFQKLSFEINLLQGRFDAMESRLAALTTANFTSAASEPFHVGEERNDCFNCWKTRDRNSQKFAATPRKSRQKSKNESLRVPHQICAG